MNKRKAFQWMVSGLAAMVILSGVPVSGVFADRGDRHHESWERSGKERQARWKGDGARFADGETVTLSFPENNSVEAVVRVINGQLFLPAQTVFDACRIPYILYPKGDILEGFANGKQFIFHADKRVMYLGGQKESMGMKAFTASGQFYVPLYAAAKVSGYSVKADPENDRITFR